jgi:hypothetical protein
MLMAALSHKARPALPKVKMAGPALPDALARAGNAGPRLIDRRLRQLNCLADTQSEVETMMVAAGLGVLVVICLLLAMMETPPHIGR